VVVLPVAAYLGLFAIALLLPILLYSTFIVNRYSALQREAYAEEAREHIRAVSQHVDRDLATLTTTLESMASYPQLRGANLADFHARARAILHPLKLNVLLVSPTGQQLLNTRLPWGAELPREPLPDIDERVRVSKNAVVSGVVVGAVAKRPVYSITVPVMQEDKLAGFLRLSIELTRLAQILSSELPQGWAGLILDEKQNVLASHQTANPYIFAFAQRVAHAHRPKSESTFRGPPGSDSQVLGAITRGSSSDWSMAVWTPIERIESGLRRAWALFAILGLGAIIFSAILATIFGRIVARPIVALEAAAQKSATGEIPPVVTSPVREVNRVSNAMAATVAELASRREQDARRAALVASSSEAMLGLSRTGIIQSWNAAAEALFGYKPEEATGQPSDILVPPDRRETGDSLSRRAALGEKAQWQTVLVAKDGHEVDVAISLAPIQDTGDVLVGTVAVVLDIRNRLAAEKQVNLMLRELSHRTKNLLSIVLSIARQTALRSRSLDHFQEMFAGRVQALSAAQDILVHHNWEGVNVAALVRAQMAPFVSEGDDRVTIDGPAFRLIPGAAESLGMTIHELATNSSKYGALARRTGRVAISWRLEGERRRQRFHMRWREAGGRKVRPPKDTGFGYVVIKDMMEQRTGGKVNLTFAPEGLAWELDAPAAQISPG
jgi:PAS domain S-box-containing protein